MTTKLNIIINQGTDLLDLYDPDPSLINIEAIASALSKQSEINMHKTRD